MSSGSDAPPKTDFGAAAAQQGAANIEAARTSAKLSNPNINNVYGSQAVTWDGDTPTVNQTLSPQQQALFDQQQGINSTIGNAAQNAANNVVSSTAKPFSFTGASNLVDKAQAALLSRLDPILARQREAQKTALITGGHAVGSEGYGVNMGLQDQKDNDAHTQAILSALGYAPQLLQQETAIRNQPINELNALRANSQATVPSFQSYQGVNTAAAPYMQAAQAGAQQDMNAYNADVGQSNNLMSGLFKVAGGLAGGFFGGPAGAAAGSTAGGALGTAFA
jgi:hypothetical protein